MTTEQIVKWIVENRRGAAFRDYPIEKITQEIHECIEQNSFLCIMDNNNIVGIVCAKRIGRVMYVYDVLSSKKGAFKTMVKWFNENYPDHILQGRSRRGKVRYLNPSKLENLL